MIKFVRLAALAAGATAVATPTEPLTITDPLATAQPGETTNNYGVDRAYALGAVQTWNADLSRDLRQVWNDPHHEAALPSRR